MINFAIDKGDYPEGMSYVVLDLDRTQHLVLLLIKKNTGQHDRPLLFLCDWWKLLDDAQ